MKGTKACRLGTTITDPIPQGVTNVKAPDGPQPNWTRQKVEVSGLGFRKKPIYRY